MVRKLLALFLTVLLPASAWAGDSWTTPFSGVRRLHRTTSNPNWSIHVLVVDLNTPGIRLDATTEAQKKRTTSSYARLVSAQAAINGDFFNYTGYVPIGLAAGGGAVWSGSVDSTWSGNIAVGGARAEIYTPAHILAFDGSWMDGVVSGRPHVLVDASCLLA
ncbi:MAG: hypothetical protein ACOX6T_00470 [Myxococcales bacterium]|jgi:hypothetical protein